jgi:hypothetical protein
MTSTFRYGLFLTGIVALLLTPLLFFGLDYTDTGYSTAMAWLQALHPRAALWDFNNFGSAFLAGFWFYTGADSLLAYRVQWELMIIGTAITAYLILTWFYDDKRAVAFALVPTLILAVFNSEEGLVVEYHNLPPFLCLVSAAFFLRFFAGRTPASPHPDLLPEREGGRKNNAKYPFWNPLPLGEGRVRAAMLASGFVAAFMVFARLPMLLWCVAVFMILGFAWFRGHNRATMLRIAAWLTLGFISGGLACVVLLYARGFTLAGIYEASMTSIRAVNNFHDYAAQHPELGYFPLLKSTAIRYFKILSVGAVAVVLALGWKFAVRAVPALAGRLGNMLQSLLLLIFSGIIVTVVIFLASKSLGFHYGPITSLLLGAPLLILAYIVVADWNTTNVNKQVLFLAAFAFFVIASLGGSGVWVSNFRHGVWLVFPIVLLESSLFTSRYVDFRIVRNVLAVGACVLGIALRVQMPYREQPTYRLNTWFSAPALKGIASSEGRAGTLEELLGELNKRGIRRGDTLQAYPSMAMLYFITKTIPWYRHPWIGQMWTVRSDLVRHEAQCEEADAIFPRYVVRGKFDPNTAVSLDADRPTVRFDVGYTPEKFYYGEYAYSHDCATFLDSLFLVRRAYTVVWENKGFVLMAAPTAKATTIMQANVRH